jgi:hypothetical protein
VSPHIEDASCLALLVPTYFGAPFAQIPGARLDVDRWVAVLAGESDAWPC